jgi:hypothetical protein
MTIQSVGSPYASSISKVSAVNGATSSTAAVSGDDVDSVDSQVDISQPAKLLTKLQDLEASDPTKAKDVLHGLADKVREQASNATGDAATRLNAFADKLDKAADSGDVSGLSPSKQGHKAHHHHGGGGGHAPAATTDTSSSDPDSLSAADPASAAYAKQLAQGGQDQAKALWDTLNTAFDSLTADGQQ